MKASVLQARRLLVALAFFLVAGGSIATDALASSGAAGLTLHTLFAPTRFSETDGHECERFGPSEESAPCDVIQVTVTNAGRLQSEPPITVIDHLPTGLRVLHVDSFHAKNAVVVENAEGPEGEAAGECATELTTVKCEFSEPLAADERYEMDIKIAVEPGAVAAPNTAQVSAAGISVASEEEDDAVAADDDAPLFGPSAFLSPLTSSDGSNDVQAADHPYELLNRIDLNTVMDETPNDTRLPTGLGGGVRDVVVDFPPGFVGSAVATPRCALAQLASITQCPTDTLVGHLDSEPGEPEIAHVNSPIYNLIPERGVAAELGYEDSLFNTHVIAANIVPTPEGYVLRATAHEVPNVQIWNIITTVWGDPSARNGAGAAPSAMFTNPADCSGHALDTTVYLDSWEHPGAFRPDGSPVDLGEGQWAKAIYEAPPVTGCNALHFEPELFKVQPDTSQADSATGLSFDLKLPQSETPETLATPPLKDATVTLPAGVIANPAAAGGLQGCSEAQIGWNGGSLTNFTPDPPSCPNASRIGSVEVATPLLEKPLTGSLYLANQDENPFDTILGGYIVIDDPATGIVVKVAGKLTLDEHTGQITGVFDQAPQLPFSELKLRFFGGTPGELATPQGCGTYTTNGLFEPWSAPESGPAASVNSAFEMNSGCSPGFTPTFAAGTTSPQAGGYAPLVLSFSRRDSEQEISGLTVTLPPGLTAKIAGVEKCSEAGIEAARNATGDEELARPSCSTGSEVGSVQTGAGVGPNPISLPGKAYLTGPYKGAPLGLVVIVPVVTGPFHFGDVVVRTALYIDPSDAHVTAVSDPLPTIVDFKGGDGVTDGFPDRIRTITINLDRNAYTLNPTSCAPMAINANLSSPGGVSYSSAARFQAAGCGALAFKPTFGVSTQGHASKASGASLYVHVTSGFGQANIGKVRVDLPKQLPSRLTTLQKACVDSVFEANPAACPEGSLVGTATATTPLLATPFTGPAYLVSHGNANFPDLEVVLQSEGITLTLDGKTDIKRGITISSFETLPDAPISSFALTLPEGSHSALATNLPENLNHNLCGQSLGMPTLITGQNGSVIKQTTKVSVTGCSSGLSISTKKIKGRSLQLSIYLPRAGKLKVSAAGLTSATKSSKGQELVSVELHQKKAGKLHTKIEVAFTAQGAKTQRTTMAVRFGR